MMELPLALCWRKKLTKNCHIINTNSTTIGYIYIHSHCKQTPMQISGNIYIYKLEEGLGGRNPTLHLFTFHPPKHHTTNLKEESKVAEKKCGSHVTKMQHFGGEVHAMASPSHIWITLLFSSHIVVFFNELQDV